MIEIFMLYLSIPSRINFLQLGRYSRFGEQRFRRQFEQGFDFFGFNKALSMPWIGSRTAVAFDPSFIHKSGKKTPGIGYFWSGCAGRALRGIEILGLSVIDADTRLSFHLDAVQTPPTNCLQDNDLSLIDWYAGLSRTTWNRYYQLPTMLLQMPISPRKTLSKRFWDAPYIWSASFGTMQTYHTFPHNQKPAKEVGQQNMGEKLILPI